MSAEGIPKSQFKNLDWTGGVVSQPAGDSNAAKKTASTGQTEPTTGTTGQSGTTGQISEAVKAKMQGINHLGTG